MVKPINTLWPHYSKYYIHYSAFYLNLNPQMNSAEKNSFDAIIVGSGISGGWAAKELCEKGLKVLMLERGENVQHPNYPTATKNPWDFPHHLTLSEADKNDHAV